MQSFLCSIFFRIWARKNFAFELFSNSDNIFDLRFFFLNFLVPCSDIAGVYDAGRIIKLNIGNTFEGDDYPAGSDKSYFNGEIDNFCKGKMINRKGEKRSLEYNKKLCKIKWDNGWISTKKPCIKKQANFHQIFHFCE